MISYDRQSKKINMFQIYNRSMFKNQKQLIILLISAQSYFNYKSKCLTEYLNLEQMLMTLFPNKQKIKQSHNKRIVSKLGISVVSSNAMKFHKKYNKRGIQNDQNCQNKRKQSVPFRSLSVERVRRKKQKKQQLLLKRQIEGPRQQILNNICQLQAQYDELKMKRSLISQRQSQASAGKLKLSQLDERSDNKNGYSNNPDHLISKCVPKSKIYLNKISKPYQKLQLSQISHQMNERSQIKKRKFNSKIDCNQSKCIYEQQKLKIMNSNSISRISNANQSLHSFSLSNLQVIPIGLNITLNKISKEQSQERILRTQKSEQSRVLSKSSNHKRGINVVSNQKSSKSSISSSSVSLYVSRQLQKDKRQKQITFLKQYRGRASDDIRTDSYYYNNNQDYLRKSSQANINF